MPTQAELWIQKLEDGERQDLVQAIYDEGKVRSTIAAIQSIRTRLTGEVITLSPFENEMLSLPSKPSEWLQQRFGDGPFTKLLMRFSTIPKETFIELAGISQKTSRGLGFAPDPHGIRGKIREASSAFILPALIMAAPVAIAGAKEGHKMYQSYQKNKKKK